MFVRSISVIALALVFLFPATLSAYPSKCPSGTELKNNYFNNHNGNFSSSNIDWSHSYFRWDSTHSGIIRLKWKPVLKKDTLWILKEGSSLSLNLKVSNRSQFHSIWEKVSKAKIKTKSELKSHIQNNSGILNSMSKVLYENLGQLVVMQEQRRGGELVGCNYKEAESNHGVKMLAYFDLNEKSVSPPKPAPIPHIPSTAEQCSKNCKKWDLKCILGCQRTNPF